MQTPHVFQQVFIRQIRVQTVIVMPGNIALITDVAGTGNRQRQRKLLHFYDLSGRKQFFVYHCIRRKVIDPGSVSGDHITDPRQFADQSVHTQYGTSGHRDKTDLSLCGLRQGVLCSLRYGLIITIKCTIQI